MKKNNRNKISVPAKLAAYGMIALLVIGLLYFADITFNGKPPLPVLGEPGHTVGAFNFINQEGDHITNKSVENKVTVVEYFFTSCPSLCPTMNKNLKEVYEHFKQDTGFVILSHTVDPERDSSSVLKAYAKKFEAATPGWQFLTGSKESLYTAASRDYLLAVEDSSNSAFIHTQYVALVDRKRQIRGFYDMSSAENIDKLERDIKGLLRN